MDMEGHHLLWKSKMTPEKPITAPHGAKIDAAVTILKQVRKLGEQAILFVQFDDQVDEVMTALSEQNVPATSVHSSMTQSASDRLFKEFKEAGEGENKTVIVLNASDETAAGLNLQHTNHIVFLSPLLRDQQNAYDDTMTQAIARARRHGQQKTIHVYRIVALDTIDVDVLEHRERRTNALTEQGAAVVKKPKALQSLEMSSEPKHERTQLVRGKDGKFTLQPQSWLVCTGARRPEQDEGKLEDGVWKGKHRVLGYEDFSSLVKFSRVYTEDDDY